MHTNYNPNQLIKFERGLEKLAEIDKDLKVSNQTSIVAQFSKKIVLS